MWPFYDQDEGKLHSNHLSSHTQTHTRTWTLFPAAWLAYLFWFLLSSPSCPPLLYIFLCKFQNKGAYKISTVWGLGPQGFSDNIALSKVGCKIALDLAWDQIQIRWPLLFNWPLFATAKTSMSIAQFKPRMRTEPWRASWDCKSLVVCFRLLSKFGGESLVERKTHILYFYLLFFLPVLLQVGAKDQVYNFCGQIAGEWLMIYSGNQIQLAALLMNVRS